MCAHECVSGEPCADLANCLARSGVTTVMEIWKRNIRIVDTIPCYRQALTCPVGDRKKLATPSAGVSVRDNRPQPQFKEVL